MSHLSSLGRFGTTLGTPWAPKSEKTQKSQKKTQESTEKERNWTPKATLLGTTFSKKRATGPPRCCWAPFSLTLFANFLWKVCFRDFDAPLQRNRYFCWSGRPSWSPLGSKVRQMAPGWANSGVRIEKCCRSVLSCCRSYGNCSGIAAPQPKPKSRRRSKSV